MELTPIISPSIEITEGSETALILFELKMQKLDYLMIKTKNKELPLLNSIWKCRENGVMMSVFPTRNEN